MTLNVGVNTPGRNGDSASFTAGWLRLCQKLNWPLWAPTTNASHSVLENVRAGPDGSFESRTSIMFPALATSTHPPLPLAVLFFHEREACRHSSVTFWFLSKSVFYIVDIDLLGFSSTNDRDAGWVRGGAACDQDVTPWLPSLYVSSGKTICRPSPTWSLGSVLPTRQPQEDGRTLTTSYGYRASRSSVDRPEK